MGNIEIEDDDYAALAQKLFSEQSGLGRAVRERFAWDIWEYGTHVRAYRAQCESPIEQSFLDALLISSYEFGLPIESSPYNLHSFYSRDVILTDCLYLEPQKEIAFEKRACRADFLLTCRNRTNKQIYHRIVVECDGHDYHERTKAQAARDKSRDRAMVAAGFVVFRFTGSEIHKDAAECADEVCRFMLKAVTRG